MLPDMVGIGVGDSVRGSRDVLIIVLLARATTRATSPPWSSPSTPPMSWTCFQIGGEPRAARAGDALRTSALARGAGDLAASVRWMRPTRSMSVPVEGSDSFCSALRTFCTGRSSPASPANPRASAMSSTCFHSGSAAGRGEAGDTGSGSGSGWGSLDLLLGEALPSAAER